MIRSAWLAVVTFVTLAGSAGCVGGRMSAPRDQGLRVRVTNENPVDMVVYISHRMDRMRLGLVRTGQTVTFRISQRVVTEPGAAFLEAEPIIEGELHKSTALIDPGRTLEWSIARHPAVSHVSLR